MPSIDSITTGLMPVNSETYSSTLSSSIGAGVTTVPVVSGSPYTDGDWVALTVDAGEVAQATFHGMKSGNSYINVVWTEGNTGVGHDAGATVQDYDSATHFGLLSKAMREQHKSTGAHADTITTNTVNENTAANGVTIDGLNIKDNKLNTNNSVIYTNLLTTIFSGQITTYTNVGTAGGSFSYVNIGGVKVLWGVTATITLNGGVANITLPVGFFAAAPTAIASAVPSAAFGAYANTVSSSTTVVGVSLNGAGGNSTVHVFAIGV